MLAVVGPAWQFWKLPPSSRQRMLVIAERSVTWR
jgi:hypothetical protein